MSAWRPIREVRMGARAIVATPDGMADGLILAADASARLCGSTEFMVGVECGSGLLWRERSEVYAPEQAESGER